MNRTIIQCAENGDVFVVRKDTMKDGVMIDKYLSNGSPADTFNRAQSDCGAGNAETWLIVPRSAIASLGESLIEASKTLDKGA